MAIMMVNQNIIKASAKAFVEEKQVEVGGTQFLDEVYRLIWKEHVALDVKKYIKDNDLDERDIDTIADQVSDAWVYEGDYDCNRSYWDNIESLVKEIRERS